MKPTGKQTVKSRKTWALRLPLWLLSAVLFIIRFLLLSWGSLAIYYSNIPWAWLRLVMSFAFLTFGIYTFFWAKKSRNYLVFAGLYLCLLAWWVTIQASDNRPWRQEVAVMPRAYINGDSIRITGFRNFDYQSTNDFTVRYEEREVLLSHLDSVSFYISYWMPGPVAHTFLSFEFDNAPPICISIETRPEEGEGFSPISSMFKQFELIYLVGSEHDIVGVRTNHRKEEVYLYPIQTSPETARKLFLVYLERVNKLADEPEFYHLLSNNCSLNIIRYANASGRKGVFEWEHLLNGYFDRYLYRVGLIDQSIPFSELRARSHINEAAQAADTLSESDFSRRIREAVRSEKH